MQEVNGYACSALHLGGDHLVQLTLTTSPTSPQQVVSCCGTSVLLLGGNHDVQLTCSLHQESLYNGNVGMNLASPPQGDREVVPGMVSSISHYVAPHVDREEMVPGIFSPISRTM